MTEGIDDLAVAASAGPDDTERPELDKRGAVTV